MSVNTNQIRDIANTLPADFCGWGILNDAANLIDLLRTERNLELVKNHKADTTKPPLGLKPKCARDAERAREIWHAAVRYSDAGMVVPAEWLEELGELLKVKLPVS